MNINKENKEEIKRIDDDDEESDEEDDINLQ